jgi:F-type H+-transporting ATPase subunit epsilon
VNLKVLLPFQVFVQATDVTRIVAETPNGSFGVLPRRLDCVAALAPGILTYQQAGKAETCIAVDEGVLVKAGPDILVSVRNAIAGADLSELRAAVEREFKTLDEQERNVRSALARMEGDLVRRMAAFHYGR